MRSLTILLFTVAFGFLPVHASVCSRIREAKVPQPRWRVDHFIYDAALHRDWEVLVDCRHPNAPARIELAPAKPQPTLKTQSAGSQAESREVNRRPAVSVSIQAGAAVEVSNAANARASILLSGTAMQTALSGQVIRIRLKPSGRFVTGIVRGPHSVELATAAKPSWRKP